MTLQTGPQYKFLPVKVTPVDSRPWPKPRPIVKRGGKPNK